MVILREDGGKTNTGMYTADKYSNIHDVLGNCREWTTEYSTSRPCVYRGGGYAGSTGSNYAATHNNRNSDVSAYWIGFRIQLYLQ